jgi:hypothetical protein
MRMRTRILPRAFVGCLLLGLASCATRQQLDVERQADDLSRKLSTFAWKEEGTLVILIAGTRPARDRGDQPFFPLQVVVANKGVKKLTITRESFELIDDEGRRYPLVTPSELLEGYDLLDFDRQLGELEGIVADKFAAYTRYPSHFSPVRTAPVPTNVVQDLVVLPRFGYLIDFLYFPTPPGGLRDRPLELFLSSPDLEDPVFLRFEVE